MTPIVIFGSEGISREVLTIINDINEKSKTFDFIGFIEDDTNKIGISKLGYKIVSADEIFEEFSKNFERLAAVIPQGNPKIKEKIYLKIKHISNIFFPNIIHPDVKIRNSIKLGIGNVITSGVKMTCDIQIGDFNLINLNSTIGHDTKIGNFNVINPLVSVSGGVTIGDKNLIGTGANILQYLKINNNITIGVNSCLLKDAIIEGTYFGIPAKRIQGN